MTDATIAVDPEANKRAQPTHYVIKTVTLDHPWEWLAKGWGDIKQAPAYSLGYGMAWVVVSYLLTLSLLFDHLFFLIPLLATGFFLVSPFLGIGLYQISNNLERNEPNQFCTALAAWRGNHVSLSAMGALLAFVLLVWMLAALVVFTLLYTGPTPTLENLIPVVFLSGDYPSLLIVGTLVGAAIAAFAFSISVVSIPLLMDRPVDILTAMHTSIEAVKTNWQAMMLWACLIVLLTGVGMVTFYIGLAVTMPLVGHATWHAYRDLVSEAKKN